MKHTKHYLMICSLGIFGALSLLAGTKVNATPACRQLFVKGDQEAITEQSFREYFQSESLRELESAYRDTPEKRLAEKRIQEYFRQQRADLEAQARERRMLIEELQNASKTPTPDPGTE